jgi:hypothetical protein
MATDRPPPYFPQGTLSPPDERRYLKFKLTVLAVVLLLLILLGGLVAGVWYLYKAVF